MCARQRADAPGQCRHGISLRDLPESLTGDRLNDCQGVPHAMAEFLIKDMLFMFGQYSRNGRMCPISDLPDEMDFL